MSKNNNYKNNKTKKNTGLKVVSVILACLTVAAGVACGLGWVKAVKLEKQVDALIQERDENADKIPMTFKTYGIVAEDYEKYGIPERATNSKLIVADFTPANTTDKRCRWSWKWKDGSTTESVEDYVCFTPAENNGASCAVGCLQAFSKTIVVTCTSVADPKITATTNIEYVTRYWDVCDEGDYVMEHFQDSINVFWGFSVDEEGTVLPDAFEADVKLVIDDGLFRQIQADGGDPNKCIEYKNITGEILSNAASGTYGGINSGWLNEFNSFGTGDAAKWCTKTDSGYIGYIEITMRCYYKGELINEFNNSHDWVLSDGCIYEISTPPQGVTTPPEAAL